MSVEQQLQTALGHHQAGRVRDAQAAYRQILAEQPNHPDALHLLGIIENQSGRPQNAVALIRRAIAVKANQAEYHQSLGLILGRMGRQAEAAAAHRRAVELNPQHRQAHYDLANLLLMTGQMEQAITEYRKALAISPQLAEAHQNLGCALHRMGRLEEAEAHLRLALAIQPKMADAHNNLGGVLAARARLSEAVAAYREALKLRPDFAAAMSNLGSALRLLGQRAEAIQVLRRAIQLAPDMPEAFNNLGIALKDDGQLDEAVATYRKCLALRPSMADATNNLGNAYKDCGNVRDTVACYGRALALGRVQPGIHSNLVYTLQFHPGYDDESLFREQRRWNELHAAPLKASIRPHENDRSPDRKLRVGYVSAYFYSQAESFFVAPLLENHDRQQFEIHCYASVLRPDQFTKRLKSAADSWHEVLACPDANLAEQIRRDRIDVLIDLAMHMAYNRMLVFARKPAPVQIAWLAYPGGTGLDAMDYRITDAFMDPPQNPATYYREQSWRLPDCWCCYDPMADLPPAAPRTDGPIRFGSINNPCKNNDAILSLWARIMSGLPDSKLLMQSFSEVDKNRIRSIFHGAGVAPQRIEFVPRKRRNDYLRLYDGIDIGLDPLPYNGITTTCDALWMGVPVVTLAGNTAAGRAGVSILSTVGLTELIARTQEQYVQIVTQLAGDPQRLAQLRSTLRERMTHSPMMDGRGFARKMESAYRQMWQRWCNGVHQAS
jgi:predicted O-linked N-acetylglucosamine transferase (SPINDLY family)